jgi:hypothetical protein
MEAWPQWLLGGEKTYPTKTNLLTPTGLLMEAVCAQNP